MTNFYILGMPRCRSLWLSHLLSFGNSYCFHESLSNCDTLFARTIPKIYGYENVGSADTYPLGFDEKLVGNSPLVLIDRPLSDIKSSLEKSFGFKQELDPNGILDEMYEHLQNIETPNSMRIQFSDLALPDAVAELMEFCGVRQDPHHINKMMNSRIIVSNDDLSKSRHALNQLMG